MSKQEMFHRQLINSYVSHVCNTPFEEFMVRSELVSRTREFVGGMGNEDAQYERASRAIFFEGKAARYTEAFDEMSIDPDHIYVLVVKPLGSTTVISILRSLS